MNKYKPFRKKINLQLFAEPSTEPAAGAEGDKGGTEPTGDNKPQNEGNGGEKQYTAAELEAEVEKRLEAERNKANQEKNEAAKLANMNAQEKAEYERDKLQEKVNQMEKERAIAQMTSTARKMLSDANINVSDDLVSMLVSEEAEKTKASVDSFVSLFNKSVENAVKDALKGEPPKAGSQVTVTKEQIMAIKDPIARQNAIKENMELFR